MRGRVRLGGRRRGRGAAGRRAAVATTDTATVPLAAIPRRKRDTAFSRYRIATVRSSEKKRNRYAREMMGSGPGGGGEGWRSVTTVAAATTSPHTTACRVCLKKRPRNASARRGLPPRTRRRATLPESLHHSARGSLAWLAPLAAEREGRECILQSECNRRFLSQCTRLPAAAGPAPAACDASALCRRVEVLLRKLQAAEGRARGLESLARGVSAADDAGWVGNLSGAAAYRLRAAPALRALRPLRCSLRLAHSTRPVPKHPTLSLYL